MTISAPQKHCYGYQNQEREMGRACCRNRTEEFWWKNVIATDHLEYVGLDVRLILICSYKRNTEARSLYHLAVEEKNVLHILNVCL